MKLLGIEEQRLRKEWISASEGSRFAETVENLHGRSPKSGKKSSGEKGDCGMNLPDIVDRTGAYYCLDCGICTGSCPVSQRVSRLFSEANG